MLNYETLPNPNMAGGFQRYFEHGIMPGSFLSALLENNLREAVGQADDTNSRLIREFVQWLYWEAPGNSWGSVEKVRAYVAGVMAANVAELEPEGDA